MDDVSPIQVAPFQRVDQRLCRGDVGRYWNIVYIAQTQKMRRVLVGLLRQRIPEKQQKVNLVTGNPRRDLLVTALFAA